MTERRGEWPVRLSASAETDFQEIVRWTARQFGPRQAASYAQILSAALISLSKSGSEADGVRKRNDIARGLYGLHAGRGGRKARHFVMFRVTSDKGRENIDVLRILHDAMDLQRHVPFDED